MWSLHDVIWVGLITRSSRSETTPRQTQEKSRTPCALSQINQSNLFLIQTGLQSRRSKKTEHSVVSFVTTSIILLKLDSRTDSAIFKYWNDTTTPNAHRSSPSAENYIKTARRLLKCRKACHPLLDARNSAFIFFNFTHSRFYNNYTSCTFCTFPIPFKQYNIDTTPKSTNFFHTKTKTTVMKYSHRPRWLTLRCRVRAYSRISLQRCLEKCANLARLSHSNPPQNHSYATTYLYFSSLCIFPLLLKCRQLSQSYIHN